MKAKLFVALAVAAAMACSAVIAGCAQNGQDGQNGKSAYEIWLDAGNKGTEDDFLEWLKGEDGASGTNGTNGTNGQDGKSAYEIWLNAGHTGTQDDFLEWLKGEDGASGANGQDGKSAYEIWLNAGHTGTQDDFLEWLKGEDGASGANGQDGKSAYEIWLDAGNIGTQEDFLQWLKGDGGASVDYIGTDGLAFYPLDDGTYAVGGGTAGYVGRVVIPSTYKGKPVTTIKDNAFVDQNEYRNMFAALEVLIPDSVTTIGDSAFYDSRISVLRIPDSVVNVGERIIGGGGRPVVWCEAESKPAGWSDDWAGDVKTIVWDSSQNAAAEDGNVYVESDGFLYMLDDLRAEVRGITRYPESNKLNISAQAFVDQETYSVTAIAANAFEYNNRITSVNIGQGIQSIGDRAFYGCSSLKEVIIPASTDVIGAYAFDGYYSDISAIYYGGTQANWSNITISDGNDGLTGAAIYYFSATQPAAPGNYWHFDGEGNAVLWKYYENAVDVTLNLGYYDADGIVTRQIRVESGDKLPVSETPVRDDYTFVGWYMDEQLTQAYGADTAITSAITLYAKWQKNDDVPAEEYIFEAEAVDLEGKEGPGFSGVAAGKNMIISDESESLGASGGKYLSYQYKQGCSITFAIVSDEAVDDAKIVLRLSMEFRDYVLNGENYTVELNGTALDYEHAFENVPKYSNKSASNVFALPFEDVVIAQNVSLNEGVNYIVLTTNNNDALENSILLAAAPIIDCLKITTTANLYWSGADGLPKDYFA